jgi:hypothetical protein
VSLPAFPLPCPPQCSIPVGSHLAKGVATTAANSILSAMSSWVVGGATWLVQHVIGLVSPETTVSLNPGWFQGRERAMIEIAALLVGPLLAAATIGAVIRQDGRRLVRIFGVGLPVGILGTLTATALVQMALQVVDEMCRLITPAGAYKPFLKLGGAIAEQQVPMFVQFIVAMVVVLAAVVLWMEMVLRATVLYIAVFFLPLGLAAFIWPATAHITKRFIELIVAVIGSKFVIVATLTLGGAVLGAKHVGIDATVTGTAILALAAFAPFSVLRLVPVVEAAASAHLEGLSRRPGRAAVSAGSTVMSSGARMAGVLGQLGGAASGIGGGGTGSSGGTGSTGQARPLAIGQQIGSWPVPPAGSVDASASSPVSGAAATTPSSGGATARATNPGGSSVAASPPSGGHADPGHDGGGPVAGGAARTTPVPAPLPAVRPGVLGAERDGWSDDA